MSLKYLRKTDGLPIVIILFWGVLELPRPSSRVDHSAEGHTGKETKKIIRNGIMSHEGKQRGCLGGEMDMVYMQVYECATKTLYGEVGFE